MQNGQPVVRQQGFVARQDDLVVVHHGTRDVVAQGLANAGVLAQIQQVCQAGQKGPQAPCVKKIFHQKLATRAQVGQHRRTARELVKAVQCQTNAGPLGHGNQVHDGVGGAAQSQHCGDCVVKRGRGQKIKRLDVLPDHLDHMLAAQAGHLGMAGVGRRYRSSPGQGQAQHLHRAGHGAGSAHGHAVARAAGNTVLDILPILLADVAGTQLGPVFPGVAAAAQSCTLVVAPQHRTGWHKNAWQVHRQGAHHQGWCGLVAATHQHAAIGGVRAEQFFSLHRQQVAVEHGGGFLKRLRQRHRRHLHREAPCLPHPPLDFLYPLLEVAVAGVDIAPGVDDGNHRLARIVAAVVAHLRGTRAMPKRPQILHPVPPVAAQFLRFFSCHQFNWGQIPIISPSLKCEFNWNLTPISSVEGTEFDEGAALVDAGGVVWRQRALLFAFGAEGFGAVLGYEAQVGGAGIGPPGVAVV